MRFHYKNKRCFVQHYEVVKEYIKKPALVLYKKWKNLDKFAVLKLRKHHKVEQTRSLETKKAI